MGRSGSFGKIGSRRQLGRGFVPSWALHLFGLRLYDAQGLANLVARQDLRRESLFTRSLNGTCDDFPTHGAKQKHAQHTYGEKPEQTSVKMQVDKSDSVLHRLVGMDVDRVLSSCSLNFRL